MIEIKSCLYDDDNGALHTEFSDNRKISILLSAIEQNIPMSTIMQNKFIWLLENEPSTLAELYFSGELESYLEWHEQDYHGQEAHLRKQLEQHYNTATARALAREFMMYDS